MRDTLLTHKGSELGALAYKPRLLLLEVPLLLRRLSCPDSAWYDKCNAEGKSFLVWS